MNINKLLCTLSPWPFSKYLSISPIFYRKLEVDNLADQVILSQPRLTIVTGPADSGKSCIMQLMMKSTKGRCQWFHMDMRQPGNTWHDIQSMYNSLYQVFAATTGNISSIGIVRGFAQILKHYAFNFRFRPRQNKCYEVKDNEKLLLAAESLWRSMIDRSMKLVLFIDEANLMCGHLKKTVITDFIDQCIQKDFHVVLSSSSSMFVTQLIKNCKNQTNLFVVGDLTKENALSYWRWLENLENKSCSMHFEEVFEKVGGHIADLRRVFTALTPESELSQMIALTRINLTSLTVPRLGIGWNKEQGEEVFKGISIHGYLEVRPLLEKYGPDTISAMIKENVICYRPGPLWSHDLDLVKSDTVDFPIITAPTPLHLWVLRNSYTLN